MFMCLNLKDCSSTHSVKHLCLSGLIQNSLTKIYFVLINVFKWIAVFFFLLSSNEHYATHSITKLMPYLIYTVGALVILVDVVERLRLCVHIDFQRQPATSWTNWTAKSGNWLPHNLNRELKDLWFIATCRFADIRKFYLWSIDALMSHWIFTCRHSQLTRQFGWQ